MSCWRATTRCLCGLAFSLFLPVAWLLFLTGCLHHCVTVYFYHFLILYQHMWNERSGQELMMMVVGKQETHAVWALSSQTMQIAPTSITLSHSQLELLFLLPTYKQTDYSYGTVRHIDSLTDLFRKKESHTCRLDVI